MADLRFVSAGDAALLIELPGGLDRGTSARAVALARGVGERCGDRLLDVVVGYCSVTLYFDPLAVDPAGLEAEVLAVAASLPSGAAGEGRLLDVPVCYGGEYGPDLADVAAHAQVSEEDVVTMHARVTYRVYMVGFIPGFAYMASVDPRIALPRRATPRERVPPGSVAIAAGQTGIYPMETPGGWHLIGRTHVRPYDPARAEPFLFRPGDHVRFHAVDRLAFEREHR
jgi:KipI family sensor histidine kinase inhibitor